MRALLRMSGMVLRVGRFARNQSALDGLAGRCAVRAARSRAASQSTQGVHTEASGAEHEHTHTLEAVGANPPAKAADAYPPAPNPSVLSQIKLRTPYSTYVSIVGTVTSPPVSRTTNTACYTFSLQCGNSSFEVEAWDEHAQVVADGVAAGMLLKVTGRLRRSASGEVLVSGKTFQEVVVDPAAPFINSASTSRAKLSWDLFADKGLDIAAITARTNLPHDRVMQQVVEQAVHAGPAYWPRLAAECFSTPGGLEISDVQQVLDQNLPSGPQPGATMPRLKPLLTAMEADANLTPKLQREIQAGGGLNVVYSQLRLAVAARMAGIPLSAP